MISNFCQFGTLSAPIQATKTNVFLQKTTESGKKSMET